MEPLSTRIMLLALALGAFAQLRSLLRGLWAAWSVGRASQQVAQSVLDRARTSGTHPNALMLQSQIGNQGRGTLQFLADRLQIRAGAAERIAARQAGGQSMRFLDFVRQQGYSPYHGTVSAAVYTYFRCEHPAKARWFHRPGSYQCAGCAQQCETDSPDGFQRFLLTDQRDA